MLKRTVDKRNTIVRAIVGIQGTATTPYALESLCKLGDLRIYTERSILFHPKLYIFHISGKRNIVWIGSANFTQAGFGKNVELLVEIESNENIEHWFEDRWDEYGELCKGVVDDYVKKWSRSKGGYPDEVPQEFTCRITFKSKGKKGNGYKGSYRLTENNNITKNFEYESALDAAIEVIRDLSIGFQDQAFLERLEKEQTIAGKPIISKSRERVYWPPSHKKKGYDGPVQIPNTDWWFARSIGTPPKLKLIIAAGRNAGAEVKLDGSSRFGI